MYIYVYISYSLGQILDYIFGKEEMTSLMSREEFEALVMLQGMYPL